MSGGIDAARHAAQRNEAEVAQARYVVRGRVQGVGFRWFVLHQASALDLGGYVRNLPDGSVEVLASGAEAGLTRLEQALHRGPSSARVENVEKSDVPHDAKLPKPFDVR